MSTRPEMTTDINKSKYDLDRSGVVTSDEIDRVKEIVEVEILGQRAHTQKKMAWISMISMVIFTLFLFSPMVSDSRVEALSDLIGLFFIAQAGVVGAYMGVTAWMSSSRRSNSGAYYSRPQHPQDGDH
jgi:Na+/H+-translocating membrane pyrophosphatase